MEIMGRRLTLTAKFLVLSFQLGEGFRVKDSGLRVDAALIALNGSFGDGVWGLGSGGNIPRNMRKGCLCSLEYLDCLECSYSFKFLVLSFEF